MIALFVVLGITLFVGSTLLVFKVGVEDNLCNFDNFDNDKRQN